VEWPRNPVYYQRVNDVAAFVLAGGTSSRMGDGQTGQNKDKAFLCLAGKTLLARALALASSVTAEAGIVGSSVKFGQFAPVVEDVYPSRGPLGGIHAALTRTRAELNLMLPVDMPFLDSRFLAYLLSAARESGALVTVPRMAEGWQPLCAVYRKGFATVAEASLRAGRNRIDALFSGVETRVIAEEELIRLGFSTAMFRNLNTPQEFESAVTEMERNESAGKLS